MASGWQQGPSGWDESAAGPSRDARIGAVASRRLRLITAEELRELGISRNAIHVRARRGRLHRIHRGVYATHPPPFTRNQLLLAAVLACGPGALLSHEPSAALQGFATGAGETHVTVASGRGRSRPAITVHRSPVDRRDRRIVERIPCTSADRTLVDLAPNHGEAELERMLVAAESLGLLKRHRLAELIAARRGRPGIARLAAITALEPALTRSELEAALLPLCRAAGLPRPRVNFAVAVPTRRRPLIVDLAWPEVRMAVEADSQRFHGDWEHAAADRERDQALALAGWACHRFASRAIRERPRAVAERLRALHARRLG